MRNYTTQMAAAKRGIITPEMKAVAICANKLHACIDPNGVGSMLRTASGRRILSKYLF